MGGGILTAWVTFTPCFLWIFHGAPFIEKMRGKFGEAISNSSHRRRTAFGLAAPERRLIIAGA